MTSGRLRLPPIPIRGRPERTTRPDPTRPDPTRPEGKHVDPPEPVQAGNRRIRAGGRRCSDRRAEGRAGFRGRETAIREAAPSPRRGGPPCRRPDRPRDPSPACRGAASSCAPGTPSPGPSGVSMHERRCKTPGPAALAPSRYVLGDPATVPRESMSDVIIHCFIYQKGKAVIDLNPASRFNHASSLLRKRMRHAFRPTWFFPSTSNGAPAHAYVPPTGVEGGTGQPMTSEHRGGSRSRGRPPGG